ncbi:ImmA/IrrE family metallo-endopeptidase [Aquipseudomonas guryensis]|uniref:ImmA/IrrE family metallo-endopeptidase n=1 Tax=Aquipseudomonas guryensis TaxID=2759165 RepID=A0A7W4DAE3_9GAMM|nr:ImmA/IrrE family metallo-endopeptidase [Pseudomonas guryensis]MBB1518940.1 ImmA/IrrE family metallo-endopeptidase [Pseudomonas guryensis]
MSGPSCEVPPRKQSEIFEVAMEVRRGLGIRVDAFPIAEVLEFVMPAAFPGFALEVAELHEMGPNHGLTIPADNIIRLRQDVYDGMVDGRGRDRFTAAHELGHYLIHRNVPIRFHRAENGRLPAYRDSEWQANTFAGALLMPPDLVRHCESLGEIVERFQVSRDAAQVHNKILAKKGLMRILS